MSTKGAVARIARSGLSHGGVPPALVAGLGAGLALLAATHHASEVLVIGRTVGPVAAFVLDGLPAVALAYAGRWLAKTDLAPEHRWTVFGWCVGGAALLVTVVGLSVLIRSGEGRTVTEPQFALLLAADAGGVAGFIAGFHHARTREAVRQAERATDALAFVNGILRHDLRNDIQVVDTYADLIETRTDDEAVRDHARTIRNQTRGAVELIESTRAVAETLAGDPDFERVDLTAIAAESADRVADAFDVTVTTDLPESAPVAANEGIRSAVNNVVENAAEHNDADDPRIDVSVASDADSVYLRVSDNGSGVSGDENVFRPGERSLPDGGLNLAETLVDHYGGDVWFEDDPDGTVFVVELPRADAE